MLRAGTTFLKISLKETTRVLQPRETEQESRKTHIIANEWKGYKAAMISTEGCERRGSSPSMKETLQTKGYILALLYTLLC